MRRMATLIADRFLSCAYGDVAGLVALDLATGARVRLRIDAAGTRAEQQAWTDACTRAHAEGTLVDFGFIGSTQRFEARPQQRPDHVDLVARRDRPTIVEWLDHARPSSSRVLRVAELPEIRAQFGSVDSCRAISRSSTIPPFRRCVLQYLLAVRWSLLDSRDLPSRAALAVLRLRQLARARVPPCCRCAAHPRAFTS